VKRFGRTLHQGRVEAGGVVMDFQSMSRIAGTPVADLQERYEQWLGSAKIHQENPDLKLIAAMGGLSISSVSGHVNGRQGTIVAIGVVYFASAYGILLVRQAFRAVPRALEDAATIEGFGTSRFIFRMLLPLTKPSLIACSLVRLTHHWNEFFRPIIVTDTVRARPLTVGLAMLTQATESSPEWTLTAAAALSIIATLFLSFLIIQRKFIDSFISSGIKG
jgi:ABC-type glycerol-3-phosphate transport system permease component